MSDPTRSPSGVGKGRQSSSFAGKGKERENLPSREAPNFFSLEASRGSFLSPIFSDHLFAIVLLISAFAQNEVNNVINPICGPHRHIGI